MPIFAKRLNFNNTNRGTNGGTGLAVSSPTMPGTSPAQQLNGAANNYGIDGNDAGTPTIPVSSFDGTAGAYPAGGLTAEALRPQRRSPATIRKSFQNFGVLLESNRARVYAGASHCSLSSRASVF